VRVTAKSKAVLVTGGAGYIGSHTCKALALAGYTPVTYDNLVHGHRWAVRWGPLVCGDVADAELLAETLRRHSIGAVIHFAGYAYVGESMSFPGKYFRNNIANTLTLLEAMESVGVDKIVFSSTCATYGRPAGLPICEDTPQEPINPYGESKLVVERMLHWWGIAHRLHWTALRYFNAAGADPDGEIGEDHQPETHLIPLAIEAALGSRGPLEIYGSDYETADGTAVRDYVHVTDLASAHVRALKYLERGGESIALNLGTGRGHSVREVVDMVEYISGRRVPVHFAARRNGDPPKLVANADRAREVLEWQPRYSTLPTVVDTAWRWHAEYRLAVARAQGVNMSVAPTTTPFSEAAQQSA
jgi:UDP-glucose-4-epimerase GalE